MRKWGIGGTVLSIVALFLVTTMGLFLYDLRRINQRLSQVERALAQPRLARGFEATMLRAQSVPAALDTNARKLRELLDTLEARLNRVAARVDSAATEPPPQASPAGAPPAPEARPGAFGPGLDAPTPESPSPARAAAAAAGYKAWLELEFEKLAAAVALTDAQREAGETVVEELLAKHFPPDLRVEDLGARWGDFRREWHERLSGLMTGEQRARHEAYEEGLRNEQVGTSTQWTVSTLDDACALSRVQKERVRESVRTLYVSMSQDLSSGQSPRPPREWKDQLRTAIQAELNTEQMSRFDEWFDTHMNWGDAGRDAGMGGS